MTLHDTPLSVLLDQACGDDRDARDIARMELALRRREAEPRGLRHLDRPAEALAPFLRACLAGLADRVRAGAPVTRAWAAREAIGGTIDAEAARGPYALGRPARDAWWWPIEGSADAEAAWVADLTLLEAARAADDPDTRAEASRYDDALAFTDDVWVLRMLALGRCERLAHGRSVAWVESRLRAAFLCKGAPQHPPGPAPADELAPTRGFAAHGRNVLALVESGGESASALADGFVGWALEARAGADGVAMVAERAAAGDAFARDALTAFAMSEDTPADEALVFALRTLLAVATGAPPPRVRRTA